MPLDLLLQGIWERRRRILLVALLLYGAAAATVFALPRRYVAQAVVAPAETTGIATSSLLSPVPLLGGGLLDDRTSGNFAVYLDSLRSPEAAAMLARDTGLLAHLTERRGAGPGRRTDRAGVASAAVVIGALRARVRASHRRRSAGVFAVARPARSSRPASVWRPTCIRAAARRA
jgi:hypothetical protein